ncbi:hypothetical protein QFC24_004877 [Naganishia onofrii]|uniref:Uncharacterized protein n=1 Tax=Naganishia onofrii TaxID=1851511 RepID=A0ACC2XC28_9TREE|nr:hypothetical protein QFC24_004877 [Naganishia onofrii]
MPKSRASRGILLTSNLPQLQNLIKRDPISYKEEFLTQYNHYLSLLRLLQHSPLAFSNDSGTAGDGTIKSSSNSSTSNAQHFRELLTFIAQVAQCYPQETKTFPAELGDLLIEDGKVGGGGGSRGLGNDTRRSIVQNLVMLRNKGVITSQKLLEVLFPLLPMTTSPSLRSFIKKQILVDLKTANTPSKNHKLNGVVQALLFNMVDRGMDADVVGDKGRYSLKRVMSGTGGSDMTAINRIGQEAMWAVSLIKELWRKSIWNDAKTVSIAARATRHPNVKVQSAAIHFFLGNEDDDGVDSDEEEEDQGPSIKKLNHQRLIKKKTKADEKRFSKAKVTANKKRKEKAENSANKINFPALELLNDPQRFGEDLYENMSKHDKQYSLEHKVLIMQLLSRVMGMHKLHILEFYGYIYKYLTYHQLKVTQILVALAQSIHELVPPEDLHPIITKIANEFVNDGVSSEVIAAGINAIREICRRQPWVMDKKRYLLKDLTDYRKSKDKGVITAARGLLALYREVAPGLLEKRDRGKAATMGLTRDFEVLAYGHTKTEEGIEGLELLEEHLAQLKDEDDMPIDGEDEDDDEGAGWNKWEVESQDSDSSSEGWQDVASDSDGDISMSDSDEDDEAKEERARRKAARKSEDKAAKRGGRPMNTEAPLYSDEEEIDDDEKKRKTVRKDRALLRKERLAVQSSRRARSVATVDTTDSPAPADDNMDAEDEDEEDDVEMETKSVVSVAAPSVAGTDVLEIKKLSLLAQTKILTPADFALLNDLKIKAAQATADKGGGSAAKRKLAVLEAERKNRDTDQSAFLTEESILGPRKKTKQDYEERMASIQKGREGREKFGSMKGKKKGDNPSSSTNREKARNKPIMMAVHSNKVVQKKKASLRDKQIKLRAAAEKQKKMKH